MSSSVAEASELLRRVAGPKRDGENLKRLFERTARALGWGYSRTKDVWYEDARRIDATEMDRLREVAAAADRENAVRQLVAMRQGLAKADPHRHRETINALDHTIRTMGGAVGAMGLRQDRSGFPSDGLRGARSRQQSKSKQYRSA